MRKKIQKKVGLLEAFLGVVKVLFVGLALAVAIYSVLDFYVKNLGAYQNYFVDILLLWNGAITVILIFTSYPKALEWVNNLKLP